MLRLSLCTLLVSFCFLSESQAQTQEEMDSQMFAGESKEAAEASQSISNDMRDDAELQRSDPTNNNGAVEERAKAVSLGVLKQVPQATIDMDLADGDEDFDEGEGDLFNGKGAEGVGLGQINGGLTDYNDAEWLWDPPLPNNPNYPGAAALYDAAKIKYDAADSTYFDAWAHFTNADGNYFSAIVEYNAVEANYAMLP